MKEILIKISALDKHFSIIYTESHFLYLRVINLFLLN